MWRASAQCFSLRRHAQIHPQKAYHILIGKIGHRMYENRVGVFVSVHTCVSSSVSTCAYARARVCVCTFVCFCTWAFMEMSQWRSIADNVMTMASKILSGTGRDTKFPIHSTNQFSCACTTCVLLIPTWRAGGRYQVSFGSVLWVSVLAHHPAFCLVIYSAAKLIRKLHSWPSLTLPTLRTQIGNFLSFFVLPCGSAPRISRMRRIRNRSIIAINEQQQTVVEATRAWNSSRKRGFSRKWKSKIAGKKIFSVGKKSTSILFFSMKIKMMDLWMQIEGTNRNLPPECLKLHRF